MHKVSSGARALAGVFATAALLITLGSSAALAASPNTSFGFNAPDIQGFPSGAVALTGGGTFNASTGFVHAGGGFSCTADVGPGVPLTGCLTGQGVRWDTDSLLSTTMFRCNTQETARPAFTSEDTVVLHADFYRAGDANDESFTANMIVTTQGLDAAPGIQNVWVQGTVAEPQPCTSAAEPSKPIPECAVWGRTRATCDPSSRPSLPRAQNRSGLRGSTQRGVECL